MKQVTRHHLYTYETSTAMHAVIQACNNVHAFFMNSIETASIRPRY